MKLYKKIANLMLCAVMVFSFAACNPGEGIPFLSTKSKTTLPDNTVTVTFPEGYTIVQIAQKLEQSKVCSAQAFLEACKKPAAGIELDNADDRVFLLEGYIFPDTYEFYLESDARAVVDKFIENYNSKITDEMKQRAKTLGYTMDQMMTLASVIQKECDADIDECANVSSVFHNRLKDPASFPKLESDVTTFYVSQNLKDVIGYQDGVALENQNDEVKKYMELYSTYYREGLPVGPICNPGLKAINAALHPAETNYVFFLPDKSGEHFYYASTIAEHNANGVKAGLF